MTCIRLMEPLVQRIWTYNVTAVTTQFRGVSNATVMYAGELRSESFARVMLQGGIQIFILRDLLSFLILFHEGGVFMD